MNSGIDRQPEPITSLAVLGARVTWTALGPLTLAVIGALIVSKGTGWATALDVCFGLVVGLMLLGRWVEQRSGSATTMRGDPTTLQQRKRYMVHLALAAAAIWVGANFFGNHVLG